MSQRQEPIRRSVSSPVTIVKILLNSLKRLLLTLFMLSLAYLTFTLGYQGATIFFGAVTIFLGAILFRKLSNEWIRAQYGEYRLDL